MSSRAGVDEGAQEVVEGKGKVWNLLWDGSKQLDLLSCQWNSSLNIFHSKRYLEWNNFVNELDPDFKMLKAS